MPSAIWTMLAAAFAPDRRALTLGTQAAPAPRSCSPRRPPAAHARQTPTSTRSSATPRRHGWSRRRPARVWRAADCRRARRRRAAARGRARALSDAEWLDLWRCVRRAQAGAEARAAGRVQLPDDGRHGAHPRARRAAAGRAARLSEERWSSTMQSGCRPTSSRPRWCGRSSWCRPTRRGATGRRADGGGGGDVPRAPRRAAAPDGFVFGRFPISGAHLLCDTVVRRLRQPAAARPGPRPRGRRAARRRAPPTSADEFDDLVLTARRVAAVVEATHPGTAGCELGVQDGKIAGQSVPHARTSENDMPLTDG